MKQRNYRYVRGSDIVRDGMFLELIDYGTEPLQQLACIFYSDATKQFTLEYFDDSVPAEVLEAFVDAAVHLLPETQDGGCTARPAWDFSTANGGDV
ncbi:hypothetical protein [Pluralibacter gergoviae]|uniref:hypothetical protein n=1 Tax=Pluralibacter gergoviae TaxID=61647 RepID=UPI00388E2631